MKSKVDPYGEIAHLYDLEHRDYRDDIDFYLNVIRKGPILEVGAGTGRITLPLLEAGFEVWAVDPSSSMLDQARRRLAAYERVHLVEADIRDLKVDVKFACGLMPLNVLWHFLDLESRLAALENVRRHMQPDGLLVVDLSNPHAMADRGANGEVRCRRATAGEEESVAIFSAAWDDEAEQLLRLRFMYDQVDRQNITRRTTTEMDLHYIYAPELELLLKLTGFGILHLYGSHDLEAYTPNSRSLIALAEVAT